MQLRGTGAAAPRVLGAGNIPAAPNWDKELQGSNSLQGVGGVLFVCG